MSLSSNSLLKILPAELHRYIEKIPQPNIIAPMLATLTKDYFSDKHWIFEPKFDGERCLAFKKNGKVTLLSRNNKEMNIEYPELVTALEHQMADNFIIDGEIVAMKDGVSSFELLQSRMNLLRGVTEIAHKVPITYCIFDGMYMDGYDIRKLPLYARKELLKNLLHYTHPLMYVDHRNEHGLEFFKGACKLHWEGLIAKKIDSKYVGKRSPYWLKFKCSQGQELVIGGFTEPRSSRTYFGALLVGYYDKGTLRYAGKVGTGFSELTLKMLGEKLRALEIPTCPFEGYDESYAGVHWVEPKLVADFEFAEWTHAGRLRVPRYKGLREDKKAQDVIREVPQ